MYHLNCSTTVMMMQDRTLGLLLLQDRSDSLLFAIPEHHPWFKQQVQDFGSTAEGYLHKEGDSWVQGRYYRVYRMTPPHMESLQEQKDNQWYLQMAGTMLFFRAQLEAGVYIAEAVENN